MRTVRCRCTAIVAGMEFADHAMTCRQLTGHTPIHRHDLVAEAIMGCLRAHGFVVAKCGTGMHEGSAKADFIIYSPAMGGRVCVDVSVTHPCAAGTVRRASAEAGHAAHQREVQKISKHAEAARAQGYAFVPYVFETFGRWGTRVAAHMRTLEVP